MTKREYTTKDGLKVEVKDNGSGFEVTITDPKTGESITNKKQKK